VIGAVQNYSGIALSDVLLIRNLQAENLILSVGGQGNAIRLSNFPPSNPYGSPTADTINSKMARSSIISDRLPEGRLKNI
jgi:hypothetical protein